MIYIVHGNNFVKSRYLVSNQQKKLNIDNKYELDILEKTPEELFEIINTPDLFGVFPFVVLDVSNAGRTNLEKYVDILQTSLQTKISETHIVILSNKSLPKTNVFIKNINKLNAKVIYNEDTPNANIFKFIDRLFEKKRKETYQELDKLLKEEENGVYIFTMILFGLRSITQAVFKSPSFFKKASFIKSKTEKQSKLYTKDMLKDLFNKLYNLEKKIKVGEIDEEILVPLAIENVLNSK